MCGGLLGSKPTPPPPLPAEPQKANKVDASAKAADKEKRRLRSGFGVQSTIATSPLGVTGTANTAGKTLLGS